MPFAEKAKASDPRESQVRVKTWARTYSCASETLRPLVIEVFGCGMSADVLVLAVSCVVRLHGVQRRWRDLTSSSLHPRRATSGSLGSEL
jgi:hypothetical protein